MCSTSRVNEVAESIVSETQDPTFPIDKNLLQPEFIEIEPGFRPQPSKPDDISAEVRLCIQQRWSHERLESALQDSLWHGDKFKIPSLVFVNGQQIPSYSVKHNYPLSQIDKIEHEILERIQQEEQAAAERNPEINFSGRWLMLRPGESATEGLGFKVALPNLSLLGSFVAKYRICSCGDFGTQYGINITDMSSLISSEDEDEIRVNLKNNSNDLHLILHGSTVAQGMIAIDIVPLPD
ncbi:MAG: hypothetical protein KME35_10055 [Aphanocapsa sp. GSE-SYN-MK-11-07L]|jgi:dUTPase|nr:hypothetical protein [Aphanocapsa sp. GSE-SYN-MK-11-07L]